MYMCVYIYIYIHIIFYELSFSFSRCINSARSPFAKAHAREAAIVRKAAPARRHPHPPGTCRVWQWQWQRSVF